MKQTSKVNQGVLTFLLSFHNIISLLPLLYLLQIFSRKIIWILQSLFDVIQKFIFSPFYAFMEVQI